MYVHVCIRTYSHVYVCMQMCKQVRMDACVHMYILKEQLHQLLLLKSDLCALVVYTYICIYVNVYIHILSV